MTWEDFNDLVEDLLTVDKDRLGTEAFSPPMLRAAVQEIQSLVPRYQKGHEDTFTPDDFTTVGSASQGNMPETADVREATIERTNETEDIVTTHPCLLFPWEKRKELTSNQTCIIDNNGKFTIDPYSTTFLVYPEILASQVLDIDGVSTTYSYSFTMVWDGRKTDFEDEDETPFDEEFAVCAMTYLKREFKLHVDEDLAMADAFNKQYLARRQNLFLNRRNLLKT